jgi:hypothetical protein
MPHYLSIHFSDQGHGKSFGGPQRLDYELLRVIADFQSLERCDGHVSDGGSIVMRLLPDDVLWIQRLSSSFANFPSPDRRKP